MSPYAAISVICLPFVWAFIKLQSVKWIFKLWIVIFIFVIGIYFSFTRAAILSIFIASGAWYIIEKDG